MKVIAFNGSPRREGNTAFMIDIALNELKAQGIRTEFYQLGGKTIHGCTACMRCMKNQDGTCAIKNDVGNECIAKIKEADGIIIGSPTYFTDCTAETKALIDRVGFVARVNDNFLKRKIGAAVVTVRRAGSIHVFDTINHFFLIAEMIVPGSIYWNMGFGLKEGDVAQDDEGVKTIKTLGQNMAWLMKKVHG